VDEPRQLNVGKLASIGLLFIHLVRPILDHLPSYFPVFPSEIGHLPLYALEPLSCILGHLPLYALEPLSCILVLPVIP
jgi:hypothetical protein